jgi:hypothetical protein
MSVKQSVEWELAGETEVPGENPLRATPFTTNPTLPDLRSNPGRRCEKPAINRLSYDMTFGRCLVRISAATPGILTEVLRDYP